MASFDPATAQASGMLPAWMWESCDSMMVLDEHRRIVAMNPALERLLGCRAAEVVGQQECGVLMRCHGLDGRSLTACAADCPGLQALAQHQPVRLVEYTVQTASGRRAVVSASYTPFRAHPESPVHLLVILREVTREKRRERHWMHQAQIDPLTGVASRAYLLEAGRRELKRALRHTRAMALLLVDVDRLKAYNDTLGHLAGDALLRTIGRLLQTGRRGEELVGRIGGDEFVVLLPETGEAGALVVAERLRRAVAEFPWTERRVPVTVSIGIAEAPLDGLVLEALLAAADRRLYVAKRAGRNRLQGGQIAAERRAQPRVAVRAALQLAAPDDPAQQYAATVNNISLKGLHCTVPRGVPAAVGDRFHLAVEIPPDCQALFPLVRLSGLARVVRLDESGAVGIPALAATRELALVFEPQLRMQAAWAQHGTALPAAPAAL